VVEDRDTVLEVGQLNVRDHAPLEATDEPGLEAWNLRWRAVTRQNNLASRLIQRVEGVEELFLGGFLALEEMDVVDEEQIHFAEAPTEIRRGAFLDGSDELVGELLGAHEQHACAWCPIHDLVRDRLHEVRLAEPGVTVNEEGVVDLARRGGNGLCGRRGKLVRLADDEILKRVARAELRCAWSGVDATAARARFGRWRNEEVHLRAYGALFVHPEDHVHGVTEHNRCKAGQQLRMLGLVPLRREPVGRTDENGVPVQGQRLRGFEPRSECLFRELESGTLE